MREINPKNIILWVVMSFVVVTILNIILSKTFPTLPVVKSGFAIPLIFVSIYIVLLFSVLYDRKVDKIELWTLIIVAIVMVVSFFIIKTYVPQLFSIFPQELKDVFSFIQP